MAQFDLKDARVYIRDGYSATGAVNEAAGYMAGATSITMDGFTGVVEIGALLTFAGHATQYQVVSTTETLGDTTEIEIVQADGEGGLTDAVADDEVITFGPHRLEVIIGEGNITYSERRNMEYKRNRGRLNTVREGDEEPMEVRMDFEWEFLKASGTDLVPTIEEALKKIGNASDWVSSSADPCEPYAVDIEIYYSPECENVPAEDIILEDFRWTELAHDASAGTVAVTGQCNKTQATITRAA